MTKKLKPLIIKYKTFIKAVKITMMPSKNGTIVLLLLALLVARGADVANPDMNEKVEMTWKIMV